MKRQLSLVLALVMILGTFTSVFAADTVTTADAIEEAGKFLDSKNILVGNEKGDLMLDETLLRQDTVVLVAKLMGEYDVAKDFPTAEDIPTYEDIRDPFYLPLLAWAQANETFVGQSAKEFGFGTDITAQEYAKVLLVALGHTVGPNGDVDVKWDVALDTAKDLGILKNIEVENADKLVRGKMAVMTFNALGVKMKDSDKTLAETLGIEMPKPAEATELTAEVNDTENLKEVVVELSNAKLVDADKLKDKNNYRIDKFKVEKVTVDGDNVILLIAGKDKLVKDREYDLTIRGLDRAIDKTYTFKAKDNASPEVVAVEVLGEYGIKVTTSEPVKDPQERDFLVDGKNIAMDLEVYGRDIILTPYYNASFSANAETLTVKGLEDFAGYKSALVDFDLEVVKDDVAPKVVDVTVDGNVVEVTFDKDVYEKSVSGYVSRKDEGNAFYRSGRLDIFTIEEDSKGIDKNYGYKVDTNKVKYEFEEDLPRRTEVTIVGVQNHSKVTMEKTTMEAREKKNNLEPVIVDYDVTKDIPGKKVTIEIEFDKAIKDVDYGANKEFGDNKYFSLFTEKVLTRYEAGHGEIESVELKDGTNDTLIIVIKGLIENVDNKYDYILEVKNIEDTSGNRMFADYIEFELKADKVLSVKDIKIVKSDKDETEIAIEFNRSVDRKRAEDATNYLFTKSEDAKPYDVADLDGKIIVERDGKTVTLELPKFEAEGFEFLEVLRTVRDKDNNRLDKAYKYDLEKRRMVGDLTIGDAELLTVTADKDNNLGKAVVQATAPIYELEVTKEATTGGSIAVKIDGTTSTAITIAADDSLAFIAEKIAKAEGYPSTVTAKNKGNVVTFTTTTTGTNVNFKATLVDTDDTKVEIKEKSFTDGTAEVPATKAVYAFTVSDARKAGKLEIAFRNGDVTTTKVIEIAKDESAANIATKIRTQFSLLEASGSKVTFEASAAGAKTAFDVTIKTVK